MALSDAQCRSAKPQDKPYKLFDTGGLYLFVTSAGGRLWRLKYRFEGKEKLLSIGSFPEIGISDARKKRNAAREKLDDGVDPAAERKEKKRATVNSNALTFKTVALEWHENKKHEWTPAYAAQVLSRLEADIFPKVGPLPIRAVTPKQMLDALKEVEARGVLETNRRLKQYCSAVFRFGIASTYCEHDPVASLRGALKAPPRPKHHKALKRSQVGDFLLRLDAYDGDKETAHALSLALLTVVRTKELRAAEWIEFENLDDVKEALWRVPAERMKVREEHLVPLSRQAVAVLNELRQLTGRSCFLFPSGSKESVMSNNTMLFALYRLGFHGRTTTHGFRRLFSTEANEHGFDEDWVERQLAHDERNRVRGAYNAAQYLPQRRKMLQWWANEVDALREGEVKRLERLSRSPG